jgi:hypothetical protein
LIAARCAADSEFRQIRSRSGTGREGQNLNRLRGIFLAHKTPIRLMHIMASAKCTRARRQFGGKLRALIDKPQPEER